MRVHIPDGFLSAQTWVPSWIISAAGIGLAARKAASAVRERFVPLMGVMAAFIFAAQMLNFPVMGGTSGHLLGGVLAGVFLGPYAGALVVATVLFVQSLVFQDGGLTALGANILNMALIGTALAYFIFRLIWTILGKRYMLAAIAVAAWLSVILASAACSIELALSNTAPLHVTLPAMVAVHAVIGLGEAVITVLVVSFVGKTRPDLIPGLTSGPDRKDARG